VNVENESGSGAVSAQEDTAKPNVAMMTRNIGHLLRLARLRLANLMDTLAQSSGTEMARTSRLLTLLEERGLVVRIRSGSDRRVTELQLTDAGSSLASRLPMILRDVADLALSTFDETNRALLVDMLSDLIGNCEMIEHQSAGRPSESDRMNPQEYWKDSLDFVELPCSREYCR
jgi:DNA-binding MarR family transcriptional regulator